MQVTSPEPSFSGNVGLQRSAFAAPPIVLALERPAIESVSAATTPTEQVADPSPEPALTEHNGMPASALGAREQSDRLQPVADASPETASAGPAVGAIAEQPVRTLPATAASEGNDDGTGPAETTGDHSMGAAAGNGGAARSKALSSQRGLVGACRQPVL